MSLPTHPDQSRGQVLDAQIHLLDRTVTDVEDDPVTVVDDLELDMTGERPRIESLIVGTAILPRFFGAKPPHRYRVAWQHVADVGTAVRLGIGREQVDITWFERWLADHVVGRIPGGRHDPE